MRTIKSLWFFVVFVSLFFYFPYGIVQARQTQQPDKGTIELLGSEAADIELVTDQLKGEGYAFYVRNRTDGTIPLEVKLPGFSGLLRAGPAAVTLKPGEVLTINISLMDETTRLKQKLYGKIIFSTRSGDFIYKNITVSQSQPATTLWWDALVTSLQNGIRQMSGLNISANDTGWVLLALFLAALLYCGFMLRYFRRLAWDGSSKLGPIEIEEIPDHAALTAAMRSYLASSGLIPKTSVPNTKLDVTPFSAVITESKLPEAKFLGVILVFIENMLSEKVGYKVHCTLSGEESKPPLKVMVEIKNRQNEESECIKEMEGQTFDEAVKKAAVFVFWYAGKRKATLSHTPRWLRFPDSDVYYDYKEAMRLKNQGNYSAAITGFAAVAPRVLFNAEVYLEWGDACELHGRVFEALEIYLAAAVKWPELFAFWYRAAVTLSILDQEEFKRQWQKLPLSEKEHLQCLLEELRLMDKKPSTAGLKFVEYDAGDVQAIFLDLSMKIWNDLNVQLNNMFSKWFKQVWINGFHFVFKPNLHQPELVNYYWRYIAWLPWSKGAGFKRMVQLGLYCCKVRKGTIHAAGTTVLDESAAANETHENDGLFMPVEKIANHLWNKSGTYYNAACFYALLAARTLDPVKKGTFAGRAMEYLRKTHEVYSYWIKRDPDLKYLRDHHAAFRAIYNISAEVEEEGEKTVARCVYATVKLIHDAAGKLSQETLKPPFKSLSVGILIEEADFRLKLWESLAQLLEKPADKTRREAFACLTAQKAAGTEVSPNMGLTDLTACCSEIKYGVDLQKDLWSGRKQQCRLYLKHEAKGTEQLWLHWRQAELDRWRAVHDQAAVMLNLAQVSGH